MAHAQNSETTLLAYLQQSGNNTSPDSLSLVKVEQQIFSPLVGTDVQLKVTETGGEDFTYGWHKGQSVVGTPLNSDTGAKVWNVASDQIPEAGTTYYYSLEVKPKNAAPDDTRSRIFGFSIMPHVAPCSIEVAASDTMVFGNIIAGRQSSDKTVNVVLTKGQADVTLRSTDWLLGNGTKAAGVGLTTYAINSIAPNDFKPLESTVSIGQLSNSTNASTQGLDVKFKIDASNPGIIERFGAVTQILSFETVC